MSPLNTCEKIFLCSWHSHLLYYTILSTVRNLEVYLDTIIPWITTSIFSADLCLFRRWRNWFHLSFCQGSTTANLYRWVSLKTNWIACRQYKRMRLFGWRGRDHAKPVLRSLHWLPIRARIQHKISNLWYCSTDSSVPVYLSDLLTVHQHSRSLPSANAGLITVPRIRLNIYGKCSFSYVRPVTWNSLLKSLRDAPSLSFFKSNLKTFLFKNHLNWRHWQSDPP